METKTKNDPIVQGVARVYKIDKLTHITWLTVGLMGDKTHSIHGGYSFGP